MRPLFKILFTGLVVCLTTTGRVSAAPKWPRSIMTADGTVIKIFKPQVLNYSDSTIQSRFVISVMDKDGDDPLFGVTWTTSKVTMDTLRRLALMRSVHVDDMRIPDDSSQDDIQYLSAAIQSQLPLVLRSYSMDSVIAALGRQEDDMAYTPLDTAKKTPVIIYRTQPAALVLIDGAPRLHLNNSWGLEAVENCPFVIVESEAGQFYLYGGGHWYVAPTAVGPYTFTHDVVSRRLRKIADDFKTAAKKDGFGRQTADMGLAPVYDIVVSTVPAILVQSSGEPEPVSISGTSIAYINNSEDNIFFDTDSKNYYVETDGDWYQSKDLKDSSQWRLVRGPQLPTDFARIPSNSSNAEVLADVPGTPEAEEIQKERSVPDVQKVDRGVTTAIEYDGTPAFSPIEGTALQYATNTCAIVLLQDGLYYTLDDGVWFVAGTPLGAWRVSSKRPADLDLIPMGHPAYRSRFVYVYRWDDDYVWDGYLPGYLDDPSGGCGLAETNDYDPTDQAWCFDLDFIFGWGGGWYDGYYWRDKHHSYYGGGGLGGKWAHWQRWRVHGAANWNGGSLANRGQWRPHGSLNRGGSRPQGGVQHGDWARHLHGTDFHTAVGTGAVASGPAAARNGLTGSPALAGRTAIPNASGGRASAVPATRTTTSATPASRSLAARTVEARIVNAGAGGRFNSGGSSGGGYTSGGSRSSGGGGGGGVGNSGGVSRSSGGGNSGGSSSGSSGGHSGGGGSTGSGGSSSGGGGSAGHH